jgi:hypothetical protein
MFRRRRIVRPILRASVAAAAGGRRQVHPELIRANELMQNGQYPEAAATFSRIAEVVRARGGPRAPFFFNLAGRCYLLAGQIDEGMTCIRQGLGLLAGSGRWTDLQRFGQGVVDQLNEKGLAEQAVEISDWLASTLTGKTVENPAVKIKAERVVLPVRCPSCGASVNSQEVTWMDDLTAECLYCGGSIRAESK